VQGDGAAREIVTALKHFNLAKFADVIILARGGGSLEDLWAFNEEVVARALTRSKIPTISAVGHEIDFTIADFVADLRAPTPSAAAELVVKAKEEFKQRMAQYQSRLLGDLRIRLATARQRFSDLASNYVFRRPTEIIRQYQQQVDDSGHRLTRATVATLAGQKARLAAVAGRFKLLSPQTFLASGRQRIGSGELGLRTAWARHWQETGHRLAQVSAKLELLSPKATLQRGYSITLIPETSEIIRSVTHVKPGTTISTKVLDGAFGSVVSSPADVQ
jgi:exodeoxyribonuclease VII large subunit